MRGGSGWLSVETVGSAWAQSRRLFARAAKGPETEVARATQKLHPDQVTVGDRKEGVSDHWQNNALKCARRRAEGHLTLRRYRVREGWWADLLERKT